MSDRIMVDSLDEDYLFQTSNELQGVRFYDNVQNTGYLKHWHESFEIVMPVIGEYRVAVGETEYCLCPGDVLVIPSRVIHEIKAPDGGERYIFLIDHVAVSQISGMSVVLYSFYPCVLLTKQPGGESYEQVSYFLSRAAEECMAEQFLCSVAAREWINLAFVALGRATLEAKSEGDSESDSPQRRQQATSLYLGVCNYIVEHCNQKLTLEDMAKYSGYSKFHFTRMFKKFSGMSFYEFYMRQRMLLCERLLTDASLSVTEAALRSGFGSIATFNRVFKEHNGMTPTAFRSAMWQSRREIHLGQRKD